jgi:hypothetical protein
MDGATVIHGKFANDLFVPDEPPPPVHGRAELIVFPDREANPPFSEPSDSTRISIFDLLGKERAGSGQRESRGRAGS